MTCYPVSDPNFGTVTFHGNWIAWVFLGAVILAFALPVVLHFYKGVVREIVIVKKRETVRDFFEPGTVSFNHSGSFRKSSYAETRHTSVDYRIKGKKLLHTKFCSKELMKKLIVGQTYTVRIRLNNIIGIYPVTRR